MHIGYAILMYVNIFPVVGISALLVTWPPKIISRSEKFTGRRDKAGRPGRNRLFSIRDSFACLLSVWLVVESSRMTIFNPAPWENKLMIVPAWKMFADGGVSAGGKWRIILATPTGEVDATHFSLQRLPHLWRDRFYLDTIFHEIALNHVGPGSLVERLLKETETAYRAHQILIHADPSVVDSAFDIYRRQPDTGKTER
jgi:hypothetical protein